MFCSGCGNQVTEGVEICPKCGNKIEVKGDISKLGISIGLLGAALYFMALINTTGLVLLAGYVLLFESNIWVKKAAVKAVVIIVSFSVLSSLISVLNYVFEFINIVFSWVGIGLKLDYPLRIDSLLKYTLDVLRILVLVGCGFKAVGKGSIKIKQIDRLVDKNM